MHEKSWVSLREISFVRAFHQILVIYFLFPVYVVINNMDVIYPFSEKENLPSHCGSAAMQQCRMYLVLPIQNFI